MRLTTITMLSGALALATSFLAANEARADEAGARFSKQMAPVAERSNDITDTLNNAGLDIRLCESIDVDACVVTDEKVICDGQALDQDTYISCLDYHDGSLGKASLAATAGGAGCASCSVTPEGLVTGSGGVAFAAIAGLALVAARRRAAKK